MQDFILYSVLLASDEDIEWTTHNYQHNRWLSGDNELIKAPAWRIKEQKWKIIWTEMEYINSQN